jgi:two-component system response regulator GlrR
MRYRYNQRKGNRDMGQRILAVDDDVDILSLIRIWLEAEDHRTRTVASAREALVQLPLFTPDLVILDLGLPDMGGLELLDRVLTYDPTLPVLMVSGTAAISDAIAATRRGIVGFLEKPLDQASFMLAVGRALARTIAHPPEESFDFSAGIIYRSDAMHRLMQQVRRAARGTSTVMLFGESGTGKELVARALHRASPRHAHPFLAINCGAMPEQLLESELFGHTKGAFTGAVKTSLGLFRAADGGTLFLDEVGDMPLPLQVRLLRVLQENVVRPLGSVSDVEVDVRVVTATHRDLEQMVEQSLFREDLFYRLNVVPLEVPPLTQRREDIPALVDHFLVRIAERFVEPKRRFNPKALDFLVNANWPGNIRQLANVVEQCVVLSNTEVIPLDLVQQALRGKQQVGLPTLEEAVRDFERDYLIRVLRMVDGNVTRAARVAGRNRTDFYNLLGRHQLDPASFRAAVQEG